MPPDEPQAASIREGALFAQEQINRVGNPKVKVIIRGRVGQWGADGVEAARLVTDDAVDGLITPPDGSASHLALQVSGRTAVPVVSLCADASVQRAGVRWALRVVPSTGDEAAALFDGLEKDRTKTNRWIAIVPDERAGREISRDLSEAARGCGRRMAEIIQLNPNLTNAVSIQERILRSRPNIILLWLPPTPAGKMAKGLRAAGYSGLLAGPGRLQSADFAKAAGDGMRGFIIPVIALNTETAAQQLRFQTAWQASYLRPADNLAAMGYDAVMLLARLLHTPEFQAPTHPLPKGFSCPGVTGELCFDDHGNRKVKMLLIRANAQGFSGAR